MRSNFHCHRRHSRLSPAPPLQIPARAQRTNEMDAYQHVAQTLSMDLAAAAPLAARISAVPGLRTSTAFFTFLRANLALAPSTMASTVNTPILEPTTTFTEPPSSSHLAPQPLANMDDIPALDLSVLTERDDKVEALRLVADSIAQQRQVASFNLVFHPASLASLAAVTGTVYHFIAHQDVGTKLSLLCGILMTYLVGIRYLTGAYLKLAEQLNWDWLARDDEASSSGASELDTVIGARYGNNLIGALVLRLQPVPGSPSKRKRANSQLKGGQGVIRAWTVKLRYRGKGVGSDLLQEAIRVTREKCGRDAEVGFAQQHANSAMVLPELFNGPFRKSERKATKALEGVLTGWEGNRRKR